MQRTKIRRYFLRGGYYLCGVCGYSAVLLCAVLLCLLGGSPTLRADWRDDIGHTKLVAILGDSAPNGSGVPISLVEAATGSGAYFPDVNSPEFSSIGDPLGSPVLFTDGSGGQADGTSDHSNSQAHTFFSNNSSIAPAANAVTIYEANDFLSNILNLDGSNTDLPVSQNFRVQNFSWVGSFTTPNDGTPNPTVSELNSDREALRRFDYSIDTNNITAVVGLNNTTSVLPHLLSHSYNSVAVGRTDGVHSSGLTHLTSYGIGRSKPDLVAPRGTTSAATTSVSSAATFLYSADTDGTLGADVTESVAMKAILLAGATKDEFPTWSQIDGGGEWHPLDDTYGAGELNIYNSYLTIAGGQSAGAKTVPTPVASHGWDYQTVLPGLGNELLYDIVIPTGSFAAELSIALTWNAEVNSPFHTGAPIVANLGLELVDDAGMTIDLDLGDGHVDGISQSDVDNVEHLYLTNLAAGTYTLKVSSEDLTSDFGLAWRTSTLFDTFSADFDEDGDTDGADFLALQRGFGTLVNATHANGDANGDGTVDSDDLAIYFTGFPSAVSLLGSSIHAVPEPSAWVLAVAGLLLVLGFRYRQKSESLPTL